MSIAADPLEKCAESSESEHIDDTCIELSEINKDLIALADDLGVDYSDLDLFLI